MIKKNGGKRNGAGRKIGSKNVRMQAIIRHAFEDNKTPLEYMLSVLNNPENTQDIRLDAAKYAAPYIHAKLQSIEQKTENTGHIVVTWKSD